jgi:hypothetical protein
MATTISIDFATKFKSLVDRLKEIKTEIHTEKNPRILQELRREFSSVMATLFSYLSTIKVPDTEELQGEGIDILDQALDVLEELALLSMPAWPTKKGGDLPC